MMEVFTVGELKKHFSEVIEKVKKGQEIIISYGKKRERVAVLIPYSHYHSEPERKIGVLKGKGTCIIHKDFKISDEEMIAS
jgi:prevent-host-death family protein